MLDTVQPPARLVAQMRAVTKKHNVPEALADVLAQAPGMTSKRAKMLEPALERFGGQFQRMEPASAETVMRAFLANIGDASDLSEDAVKLAAADAIVEAQMADTGKETREPARVGHSWERGEGFQTLAVAALSAKLNPKGPQNEIEREAVSMTLPGIAMQICRENGLKPFNEAEAVRMAAHSTSDFPLILENSMTNAVARRIEQRMPAIVRASHEVARDDYRAGNLLNLSATAMPKEIAEDGEIQFVKVSESGEALPKLRDFGSGFALTNQALQNDSTAVGMLGDLANRMTEGAVERLRAVLLEPVLANSGAGQAMSDGVNMFHADHGNLASSGGALSVTTLSAARTAMRKQTGLQGEKLAIEPWGLVVPPELETAAQQVLASINATKVGDANPFQNSLELIVEPGLSSATAWYLIADPASRDGLAHAFLEGQRTPRVETRDAWSTLGMELRLVWALDAKFVEYRTWYRNAGA